MRIKPITLIVQEILLILSFTIIFAFNDLVYIFFCGKFYLKLCFVILRQKTLNIETKGRSNYFVSGFYTFCFKNKISRDCNNTLQIWFNKLEFFSVTSLDYDFVFRYIY